jgi:hypothetical protein
MLVTLYAFVFYVRKIVPTTFAAGELARPLQRTGTAQRAGTVSARKV